MKRQRYLLPIMLLLLVTATWGRPVTPEAARLVGQAFLQHQSGTLAKAPALERVSLPETGSTPYLYVFNMPDTSAYVIVAADDRVAPVLGYSTARGFDPTGVPPQLAKWLEGYRQQVRHAIATALPPTAEIDARWATLRAGEAPAAKVSAVNPLVAAKWDQAPYFNALAPFDNATNQRTVAGCVATAMAQIMKYWSYPTTGSGFHSYNHSTYGTLSATFGSTTYDWNAMPNVVNSPNSAVATLLYHCGVSVDMNFGVASTGGSGAYVISDQSPVTHCSEYALKTYFGYEQSLQGVQRVNYGDAQWKNLLRQELDAGRPILYAGFGSGGGHAFVCDGYDNNDFFHFNWGWGGSFDGYFTVDALNPSGVGTGGGTGGYNSGQQVLIGVQPPGGGNTPPPTPADIILYDFLTASASTISYGQPFSVTTNVANNGATDFTGDYAAAVFNAEGNFIDFVEIKEGWSLQSGFVYTNGLTFATEGLLTVLPGEYFVSIFYRPTGDNWYQVGNSGNYTNGVPISVVYANPIELNAAINVTPGTTVTQGQGISANLNIINTGNTSFVGTYEVNLYDLNGNFVENIGQLTESEGLPPNFTYLEPFLTFSKASLSAAPGTYLLAVTHTPNGGSPQLTGSSFHQNPIYVDVQATPPAPDAYENNDQLSASFALPFAFSGQSAAVATTGSNCHTGSDYDYYRADLPPGFVYALSARLHDAYRSDNGQTYSLDALFSYSLDGGNTWSDAYDDVLPGAVTVNDGGTVHFKVSPYFTGEMGTYLLDLSATQLYTTSLTSPTEQRLTVYPNPAREEVRLSLDPLAGRMERVQVLDLTGRVVRATDAWAETLTVPVRDLPTGTYLLRVQTGSETITKKVSVR